MAQETLLTYQQPSNLAEELFGQRVVVAEEGYRAWLEQQPVEQPSGNGYAQLIYAAAARYQDYALGSTPSNFHRGDELARKNIAMMESIPEKFWRALVDVVDRNTAERSQVSLWQFVTNMRYQSEWAIHQREKRPVEQRQPQKLSRRLNVPIPGLTTETSHIDHSRESRYYDSPINKREVPPFDHWWHHHSHRECPENIGLTPEQNDWATEQIYSRLTGHELAWADQLIQGF